MEVLKDHRAKIDEIDDKIVELMRQRYAIIAEVAKIKAKNGIPASLPDRIEEVKERNAASAKEMGLNPDFIRDLYSLMIDYAISFEDAYIDSQKSE